MKRREFMTAAGTVVAAVGAAGAWWMHREGIFSVGARVAKDRRRVVCAPMHCLSDE
jgi:hypothetical protein